MNAELVTERLFHSLISGDRSAARTVVEETVDGGVSWEELATAIFWPSLEMVSKLYRADQLTTLAHNYATRMLRSLIDQAQAGYEQQSRNGRKILLFSGPSEVDELAGQVTADLAEAGGYEVLFGGGGIANDEILGEVGEHRPDILLLFASAPTDLPNIRHLIDHIREVGSCPQMQIVVGGGVFNRAEGLAEEIGADLWARDPEELLDRLAHERDRRAAPDQRTVGKGRANAA